MSDVIYRNDRLKAAKAIKGLSNEAIAELSGLHRHTVGQIIKGSNRAWLENLKTVADVLGVPMHELFNEANQ